MNLLEKIEAALDSATPPMSDLLRECEAYVRAGMDQPPVIYIAEDDAGGFMASRTPDEDEPWSPSIVIRCLQQTNAKSCC